MSYDGAPAGLAIIYDDSYGPGCNTSVSTVAQADMADCCNTLKGHVIQKPQFCQLPQADWHNLTTCFVARNASREDGLACIQTPLKDADRRQVQLGGAGYAIVGLVCLSAALATVGV